MRKHFIVKNQLKELELPIKLLLLIQALMGNNLILFSIIIITGLLVAMGLRFRLIKVIINLWEDSDQKRTLRISKTSLKQYHLTVTTMEYLNKLSNSLESIT